MDEDDEYHVPPRRHDLHRDDELVTASEINTASR